MPAPAQRILVPTDFSNTADRALELALELARRFAAEIHLLHVRVLLEDPHHEEEYHRELERLMTREDQRTREVLGTARDAIPEVVVHPHLVRGLAIPRSMVSAIPTSRQSSHFSKRIRKFSCSISLSSMIKIFIMIRGLIQRAGRFRVVSRLQRF